MNEKKLGIIGGSGLYNLGELKEEVEIQTEFGLVYLKIININGFTVYFLPRHGEKHEIPPHKINFRSNILAFKECGIKDIISTSAVGSLRLDFKPGMFGTCYQFIDFTKSRNSTYFDSFKGGAGHTDMTEPYSNKLNNLIEKSFIKNRIDYIKDLTMIVTEGPRFETKAEIKAYSILGGEIVGMTGYPEVALAKELKLGYSSIAICTNYAAGISPNPLSHQEVIEVMNKVSGHLQNIISDAIILYYS